MIQTKKSFIDIVRSHPSGQTTLKSHPWWELEHGWRVHLSLDQSFCLAWNRYSGEVSTWQNLIPQLYPETNHGNWVRLISDAIIHGKNS